MAIVINGSGTISGISVGGLPDSIVDAGTLATNSVDSAELIDGSIDNSHLADDAVNSDEIAAGAIDAAHLASGVGGKVLQVVHFGTTTGVTNNSSTYVNSGLAASITPVSTSSKILILISQNIHKGVAGQTDQMQLNITKDDTQLVQWASEVLHDDGELNHFDIFASQSYLDSPSSTSALTYRTQFRRRLSTSAVMSVQYAASRSSMTLMEIAG